MTGQNVSLFSKVQRSRIFLRDLPSQVSAALCDNFKTIANPNILTGPQA